DQLAQFVFQLRDALGQRAGRVGIDVHQAVEQFRQPQQALAVPAHVERVAAAAQFARLRLPAAALVELAQRQAQARGDAQVGVAPRRAGAAHGLGPGLEAAARPEALAVVAELHRLVGAPGPAHLLDLFAAAAQFARLRLPAAALVELAQRQAQARGDAQVGVAPRRAGAAHGLGPGLEAAARPEALAVVAELHRLVGAPGPAHLLDLFAA